MKKKFPTLLLAMSLSFFGHAQSLEKVKGDRNVTKLLTAVPDFHTLILDEAFEIDLVYSKDASVEIETDENLHEVISFDVRDSILNLNLSKRITSKKRLRITVNYNDFLSTIETRDDAELHGISTLKSNKINLTVSGNSKAGLTIKTDHFNFEGLDKSKTKLNVTSNTSKIILNGNSSLEALVNSGAATVDLYQRAQAEIEGSSNDLSVRTDNNAVFNGKNFTAKQGKLISEIDSEITVEVTDSLDIEASGGSAIYLYGDPKIIVNKFTETAKIQKREK
ncbi:GIN domain-containing protein [Algibacter miyuki]|uniref:GIN domain-containing protein n=1 Tax=Algibacter miyuki TaxID=1306933 RepID=A0ABV5GZK2_9FLAO|nr:DUF2807 domain-containing protein [Algibacter miyuki]MDN3666765.1 DUF2807 domain-containing protein [Algibacter miyuki]